MSEVSEAYSKALDDFIKVSDEITAHSGTYSARQSAALQKSTDEYIREMDAFSKEHDVLLSRQRAAAEIIANETGKSVDDTLIALLAGMLHARIQLSMDRRGIAQ